MTDDDLLRDELERRLIARKAWRGLPADFRATLGPTGEKI